MVACLCVTITSSSIQHQFRYKQFQLVTFSIGVFSFIRQKYENELYAILLSLINFQLILANILYFSIAIIHDCEEK